VIDDYKPKDVLEQTSTTRHDDTMGVEEFNVDSN